MVCTSSETNTSSIVRICLVPGGEYATIAGWAKVVGCERQDTQEKGGEEQGQEQGQRTRTSRRTKKKTPKNVG